MGTRVKLRQLPTPGFFEASRVGEVWKVPYEERARQAADWAAQHAIPPAAEDQLKIVLLGIDVQNTFCIPGYELFVGGRSGNGAVEDNIRLAQFIYTNLVHLSEIALTMDTHQPVQIFHAIFLIDERGRHPDPLTLVTAEDVEQGRWRFNPAVAPSLGISPEYGQAQLQHYTRQLANLGKYALTIWPYHAMLGGIGHALVPAIEEAVFFHAIARCSQPDMILKGSYTLTESYSAIGPEVVEGPDGGQIAQRSGRILDKLLRADMLIIAGQAKSHCVAWTIDDLLSDIRLHDPALAGKIYLLEDCTSPVVVPGVVDYTEEAAAAYARFAEAGMHLVQSTQPMDAWPGLNQ